MASCRNCDNIWTGLNMAHCPTCCRTFSTPNNFFKHRVGDVGRTVCVDPGTILDKKGEPELVLRTTGATPTWAAPSDPELAERLKKTGV